MDLAELIYQALRRHLGDEKEEAALRATAEKIATVWSKEMQPQDREELVNSGEDAETPGREGDSSGLR